MRKSGAWSAAKERAEKRKETMVRNVHNYFKHQRDVFLRNSKCTCTACTRSKSAAEPIVSLSFKATEMATGIVKKKVYRIFKKSKKARWSRSIPLERSCDAELVEAQQLRAALSSGQSLDWWHLAHALTKDPRCISLEHLECVLQTKGFVLQPWNDDLVPIEKGDLVQARTRYLDEIETARRKESTVVYIDARWLRGRRLRPDPRPEGRSKLLMFAGSFEADPVFKLELGPSVSDVEDVFVSWVSRLSLDLPEKSTLVFVDVPWLAAPTSQVPSEVTPKTTILRWLSERAVKPGVQATRWELLELVKRHTTDSASKSRLEAVVESHGHRVLRVPANVADLNPVTRIWPPIEEALASELLAKQGASAVCEEGLRTAASAWRELVSQPPVVEERYRAYDATMAGLLAKLPPNTNPYRDDSLLPRVMCHTKVGT